MTKVISITTIITDKFHRISRNDMLRMIGHKLLHTIPQRRDSLPVLVQAQHKTILLIPFLHDMEGVKREITKVFSSRLDPPVELIIQHQRVSKKEARLVSTHEPITLGTAVDSPLIGHLHSNVLGLILIDPVRVGPLILRDEAVKDLTGGHARGEVLERLVERFFLEKDPVVVVFIVETVIDTLHGLDNIPQVRVAAQSDECGIHALWACFSQYRGPGPRRETFADRLLGDG